MSKRPLLDTLKDLEIYKASGFNLIETHCHLDYFKQIDLDDLMMKAKQFAIKEMITISVEPGNLQTVLDLADRFLHVYTTQGIHPHNASECNDEVLKTIKQNLSHPKVVAVGEIGLDYYYNKSSPEVQKKVFEKLLQMACEADLPVVIHTRDADEDTMAILKNIAPYLKKKGVLHSFTSSLELAQLAIDLGFCIGINGIVTFKNAQNVRDVLKIIPLENILLETDSPFLAPTPYRGDENNPLYLPLVAQRVCEEKNIPAGQLLIQVEQNSRRLFGLEA